MHRFRLGIISRVDKALVLPTRCLRSEGRFNRLVISGNYTHHLLQCCSNRVPRNLLFTRSVGKGSERSSGINTWLFWNAAKNYKYALKYRHHFCSAGHAASTGRRCACRDLEGKTEGRRHLGRPKSRWKDNIKMHLRTLGWGAWTGSILLRIGTG